MRKSFWLIAPYAAWMTLMAALPATATAYAVRTAVTAALLATGWRKGPETLDERRESCLPSNVSSPLMSFVSCLKSSLLPGLLVGLAVFAIWILPEQFDIPLYRRFCIIGEGGTQAVAEASAAMIAVRLVGSAFVISVAEELFFRKWLIVFAGFWWMVGLFANKASRRRRRRLPRRATGRARLRTGPPSARSPRSR